MADFARHTITATALLEPPAATYPSVNSYPSFTFYPSNGALGPILADLTDARVTMDEGWSPFIQAELTLAVPNSTIINMLDPRESVRVRVQLKQEFGTTKTVADFDNDYAGMTIAEFNELWAGRSFADFNDANFDSWNTYGNTTPTGAEMNLHVRSREVDHVSGELRLELASDEALLQDYALISTATLTPSTATVRAAVELALFKIGATLATAGENATVGDVEAMVWEPGVTGWDYVSPLVQKANLRLYCDSDRVWRLVSALSTEPGLVSLSAENNVTLANDTITLEEKWFDAVVVSYKWDDASGLSQVAYDIAGSETPKKVATYTIERPYPGPGAAQALLQRASGRGRVLDVSATSDYSAIPGKAVSISLPNTPAQTGFISSVEWSFPDDEMTVKSRGLIDTPLTAWIFDPSGVAWEDVPTGTDWTED